MLPTAWWLFWWILGILVTLGLAAWFVRAARREDSGPAARSGGDPPASTPSHDE